jgi:hypothetical protein
MMLPDGTDFSSWIRNMGRADATRAMLGSNRVWERVTGELTEIQTVFNRIATITVAYLHDCGTRLEDLPSIVT